MNISNEFSISQISIMEDGQNGKLKSQGGLENVEIINEIDVE